MNINSTYPLSAKDSQGAKSLFNLLLGKKILTKYTLKVEGGIHHFSLDFSSEIPSGTIESLRKFIQENVHFLLIEEK